MMKFVTFLGLLLAGAHAQQAANCEYQSLKCGSVLLAAPYSRQSLLLFDIINLLLLKSIGYTSAQLIAAVNDTASIPVLTTAELSATIFHCYDILGDLTGNSYCFAGCDTKPGTRNDQCIL